MVLWFSVGFRPIENQLGAPGLLPERSRNKVESYVIGTATRTNKTVASRYAT